MARAGINKLMSSTRFMDSVFLDCCIRPQRESRRSSLLAIKCDPAKAGSQTMWLPKSLDFRLRGNDKTDGALFAALFQQADRRSDISNRPLDAETTAPHDRMSPRTDLDARRALLKSSVQGCFNLTRPYATSVVSVEPRRRHSLPACQFPRPHDSPPQQQCQHHTATLATVRASRVAQAAMAA